MKKITTTTLRDSAKFYLQTQGQRGTEKQVDRLLKQLPANNIYNMAVQRGYKN